jgi:hypothetical protein
MFCSNSLELFCPSFGTTIQEVDGMMLGDPILEENGSA